MASSIFYLISFVAVCFSFVQSQYEVELSKLPYHVYILVVYIIKAQYTELKVESCFPFRLSYVVYTVYGFVEYANNFVCEAMISVHLFSISFIG